MLSVPARSPGLQFGDFCSVAKSIALISSSWSGAGLLTTTVSDASVSDDSVGESIGDAPTVNSTVGCCFCFGCVGLFAPRWSGACADSSPVPGASSFGSLVDGGGGGSGRASANVCALTLVVWGWLLLWVVGSFAVPLSIIPDCKCAPASTCWGAGWTGVLSGSCPGWLAVGRLSASVRCPKEATIACNSMYRFSCSASC